MVCVHSPQVESEEQVGGKAGVVVEGEIEGGGGGGGVEGAVVFRL